MIGGNIYRPPSLHHSPTPPPSLPAHRGKANEKNGSVRIVPYLKENYTNLSLFKTIVYPTNMTPATNILCGVLNTLNFPLVVVCVYNTCKQMIVLALFIDVHECQVNKIKDQQGFVHLTMRTFPVYVYCLDVSSYDLGQGYTRKFLFAKRRITNGAESVSK